MKKININSELVKSTFSSQASKKGSYSVVLSVVVIAIALVLSMLVGLLPDSVKQFDISESGLYDVSDTTTELLSSVTDAVSFKVIANESTADSRITRLIRLYENKCDNISVEYIDPVVSPALVSELGAAENSVIVTNENTGKSTTVLFSDIIKYDEYSYYYYGQNVETEFDGEGQLTSAVRYVTKDVNKTVYLTSGHGETSLGSSVADRLSKLNINTGTVNLLLSGAIPDDCSLLLINGPTTDISEIEKNLLIDYIGTGGNVMFVGDYEDTDLPNFEALLLEYGIASQDGYIADYERYYSNSYFYIFPKLSSSSEITSGFPSDSLLLLFRTTGYTLTEPARDNISVNSFLTTTENGYAITADAESAADYVQGEFVLGATATETLDDGSEGKLLVLSSNAIVDESVLTNYPSLVNCDVFINSVTWFMDGIENESIPAKSLQITYNTVSGGGFWRALFVIIIPLALIVSGLVIWNRRRKA